MTKAQLAHLQNALNKAKTEKVAAFVRALKLPKLPTKEEKLDMIFSGQAVMLPRAVIGGIYSVHFENGFQTHAEHEHEMQKENIRQFTCKCQKEGETIYERAVFLGAEDAFKMLEEFRAA